MAAFDTSSPIINVYSMWGMIVIEGIDPGPVLGELLADKDAYMSAAADHPMRSTAAWFATEVTEEVDLPEELKELGTLRTGFLTHWKDSQ